MVRTLSARPAGSSRTVGAVPHDTGGAGDRPSGGLPIASLRSTGWPGWRFSVSANDEFHHTKPRIAAAAAIRRPVALSLFSRQERQHEQDADDEEVDDPVAAPGEHPERPERAVHQRRVEQDQRAGQRGTVG